MSVVKSLEHSAFRCNRILNLEVDISRRYLLIFPLKNITFQWVDSTDLEPETLTTSPVKYHDAWRALVAAKYTHFLVW